MKEQTRYRVTGSLFLLALAVICLPMLFDGAGLPARELPDLPEWEAAAAEQTAARPVAARSVNESVPGAAPGRSRQIPESDVVARVEKLRQQVDEEGFLTQTGTRFGEPVLTTAKRDTEVWAVQVASFRQVDNAEEFRTRLREDGYEAFISTAKADEQVLSRVAVGPLLDRERAERLRGELSARYDIQARLVAFSN